MLPLPESRINGVRVSHAELRALHIARREAIREATARYCIDGPRLLRAELSEGCSIECYRRDRTGSLLAACVVDLPFHGQRYVRRVRLVREASTDVRLRVALAREERDTHT